MSLANEMMAKMPSKWYACWNCPEIHESKTTLNHCPKCNSQSELTVGETKEAAEKHRKAAKEQEANRVKHPIQPDELEEALTRARSYYFSREMPQGDLAAARWLIKKRSVKTDMRGKIFAYSDEAKHYKTEGETLLKADIVKEFGSIAGRTRVGEILAKVQALSYCDEEVLTSSTPPNLLNLENGVFDLETKSLLPHSSEYFFTYKHPVNYAPDAQCTIIHKFLEEIVHNVHDKEILLDIVALCLYRARLTRHFFVLVGGGHNGKSLFLTVLRTLLGENRVVSLTPQALAEDTFAAAQLFNKHANLGADIPGGIIRDTAIVKSATGGDAISVQRKGVDRDERKVYCEFVWASNDPPRITEDTLAIWDRIIVVKFPFTFVPNPKTPSEKQAISDLESQLITPQELSGLLNEAIRRLPSLIKDRKLSVPIDATSTRREYRTLSDTPAVFVDEMCEEVPYEPSDTHQTSSGYLSATEAYQAYKQWCKDNRAIPVSMNRFGRAMEGLGFERGRDNQQRSYRGLQLKRSAPKENNSSLLSVSEEIMLPSGEECPAAGMTESPLCRIVSPQDILSFITKNDLPAPRDVILEQVDDSVGNYTDRGFWLDIQLRRLEKEERIMRIGNDSWTVRT